MVFLGGSDSKESACNAGDPDLILVGKIPWRREWLPTPVLLPREFLAWRIPWTEEPGGLLLCIRRPLIPFIQGPTTAWN